MTQAPIDLAAARKHVARIAFGDDRTGDPSAETPGGIGLEPEYFVVRVDQLGGEHGRPRLYRDDTTGEPGILDWLEEAATDGSRRFFEPSHPFTGGAVPRFDLACGGQLTFEPGGQVEHSTRVHAHAAHAMEDLDRVRGLLASIFERQGCAVTALGVDPWHDVDTVPQQLPGGRYRAQAEFYEKKSRFGRIMMRNSTSLQINLDFGDSTQVATERWNVTNLVSPLITCTFSTSPGCIRGESGRFASRRAHVWHKLDPTRTGFSRGFLAGNDNEPALCYADQVLDSDVMLFRRAGVPQGMATGGPGFTFRNWIESGHPEFGVATKDDLDYHLTTVFPEVRARGFMELRAADGLPADLAGPFVVFLTGLVYDPTARREALELLAPHRPELDLLWERAAKEGLGDQELCALCRWTWTLALEGARRLPVDFFRAEDLAAAENFLDRFVLDCRSTSDELGELLSDTPGAALTWGR
jgi:glutamate--cysteine ligase